MVFLKLLFAKFKSATDEYNSHERTIELTALRNRSTGPAISNRSTGPAISNQFHPPAKVESMELHITHTHTHCTLLND